MKTKRIVLDALLTALALSLFLLELQIPSPVPIPGIKLGLANIITLVALFLLSAWDAAAILTVRILLGAIFGGNFMAFWYSAAGGLLCFLVLLLVRRLITQKQIWVCSALGAMAHNVGQMAVALLVTRTGALIVYLPVLLVSGILTGIFTGLAAQFLLWRLKPAIDRQMKPQKPEEES